MTELSSDYIFKVRNICASFRNGYRINYMGEMVIKRGCFTFITGKSGIGKSTLLHIIGLLNKAEKMEDRKDDSILKYYPYEGEPKDYFEIFRNRWEIFTSEKSKIRRSDFGFLPQHGHLLKTYSVQENIAMILRFRHRKCLSKPSDNPDTELQQILDSVGFKEDEKIWERRKQSPMILSGGQQQRLALARAISCDCQPKIIFVDEPTTYMDQDLIPVCIEVLVKQVVNHQCSIILVTHKFEELKPYLPPYIIDHYTLERESVDEVSKVSDVSMIRKSVY